MRARVWRRFWNRPHTLKTAERRRNPRRRALLGCAPSSGMHQTLAQNRSPQKPVFALRGSQQIRALGLAEYECIWGAPAWLKATAHASSSFGVPSCLVQATVPFSQTSQRSLQRSAKEGGLQAEGREGCVIPCQGLSCDPSRHLQESQPLRPQKIA